MKTKLIIHQPKIRGCDDSFFYEGLIAEKGKHKLYAVGEIRIYQEDKKGNYVGMYDRKARDSFDLNIKTDKDLTKIGSDYGDKYRWDMNNWFEVFDSSDEIDIGIVYYSYKEALNHLKSL